jgi:hypothetical protein
MSKHHAGKGSTAVFRYPLLHGAALFHAAASTVTFHNDAAAVCATDTDTVLQGCY